MNNRRLVLGAIAGAAGMLSGGLAMAQATPAYPTKPVKLLVGFTAGAATDIVARTLAQRWTEKFGQPFVVENRTGANGMLAAQAVAQSDPDGHTLLFTTSSPITLNRTLYAKIPYNPDTDFTPVTTTMSVPLILVVNAEAPGTAGVRTIEDLVRLAKEKPGQIAYGSAGLGNITQLAMEWFSDTAGIKMNHIPYRGGAGQQQALLAKEVSVVFDTLAAIPLIQSGKFRALAVSSLQRNPGLPDVKTMDELGYKDFDITFWVGLFAKSGTPRPVIDLLYNDIVEAVKDPKIRDIFSKQGRIETPSPDEFRKKVGDETRRLASIVQKAGIKLQP
ncbi:MAG: tripartite tricarboxylate transporter substrate binding protein [Burkholderiaceae bacterium]|nr:tripartite tricarboxylate transporter substrate binding protein [Burkholderiaceae bacterium]